MSARPIDILDHAMADVEEFLLDHMERHGHLVEMYVGWPMDRRRIVLGVQWERAELRAAVLRTVLRTHRVVAYAAIHGAVVGGADALVCSAFARGGRWRSRAWWIIRELGRFKALEPTGLPGGTRPSGWAMPAI
jgi:hypothetical protein